MGESINLVAIKSVMTDPQIVQESSKEPKTKKRETEPSPSRDLARALRGVHPKEMKSVVLIWMWNVPHSLRHLNTWSPVGGAVCGGFWDQPCWRTSLGSGLETESLTPCQISLLPTQGWRCELSASCCQVRYLLLSFSVNMYSHSLAE